MIRSMAISGSGSGSSPPQGIAVIVGVGPKLGRSIAGKFAHEGYTVAILGRDMDNLSRVAEEIAREEKKAQVFAIHIDCSDSKSISDAFETVLSLGFVEVLVYNANHQPPNPTSFLNLPVETLQYSLDVSIVGAFHCAQQVIPNMVKRAKGTILFTGCSASLSGIAGFSQLSCGKFALRALAQCLASEFQPQGVHIAHVIIDGVIGIPRQRNSSFAEQARNGGGEEATMDPDTLAQTYWQLHVQDRNTWTHEMDLHNFSTPIFF